MLNAIPFVGWLLSFIGNASMAVVFWLIWTVGGIGQTFLPFLPVVYLHPGFWATVGLFMVWESSKTYLLPDSHP